MIVVFPFCLRDQDLALKNAQWMRELGGCKGHELLVCYDPRCAPGPVEEIRLELAQSFDKLYKCTAQAEIDGWPEGANYFFRITTAWLQGDPGKWPYFFWMEPDAIPLSSGWLDALEAEYKRGGKPFMGDRVEVGDIPLHMSGVGIYQNPVYLLAGEAYRAHDTAFDMAAKDQIVPQAHFTNLIEHAWKHPKFTSNDELRTQIAPETILFHSSKDGSLIDLLRQKNFPAAPVLAEPFKADTESRKVVGGCGGEARESTTSVERLKGEIPTTGCFRKTDSRGGGETFEHSEGVIMREGKIEHAPIYDIFIRTYPGDYQWLEYCLQSIAKYVRGFRKLWIVSPAEAPPNGCGNLPAAVYSCEWKVMNDETEDGYLAQQITKLYADVLTDYQADYILHVDSDIIFTRPTTPGDFFTGDKLTWYYTPHEMIRTPWQPIMEKFMGFHQPYEFMRRLPMMMPRWLYPRLREFAFKLHRMPISQYVANQPMREFSEFNILGAYAFFHHADKFAFVDTSMVPAMPPPFAKQFHSWSGLTEEVKSEIETILRGGVEHRTNTVTDNSTAAPPSQIKVLANDVWVLEGDQISGWVEQEGRLDHDQNLLPDILKHIRPGDTVVDAGAFIGDHTVAYSQAVGDEGIVHAFEPNPVAYQCLSHNLEGRNNVILHGYGLSNTLDTVPLSGNNGNWGGAYVGEHMKITDVRVRALETEIPWRVNFIKIDAEGYELKVLQGAGNLINRCRPKMVIEINSGALARQGATPDQIFGWLTQHGYDWKIIQENCLRNDPLYDILCLPKQPPENPVTSDAVAHLPASSPVAPLTTPEEVQLLVDQLQEIADASPGNKAIVTSKLFFAGLRQKVKRKLKKKTKHKPWP